MTPLRFLIVLAIASPLPAQDLGWSGAIEANGSLYFGNVRDRIVAGRTYAARADSTLEVRADFRATYSDRWTEDLGRHVSGRTTLATLGADYRPFASLSPFWFGAVESSLQQRIDQRLSSGVGAKWTFYRQDANDASLSVAILAERTRALGGAPTATRQRWSFRGRVRRAVNDAISLSHTTFYQPSLSRVNRFTVNSTTSLAARMTSRVSLTVTLVDVYDSEARSRGAREYNDGQLLFGFKAEY